MLTVMQTYMVVHHLKVINLKFLEKMMKNLFLASKIYNLEKKNLKDSQKIFSTFFFKLLQFSKIKFC